MLSIIPFDRVTSTAASREPERPFKAYLRTPVSVPAASSYYGPFTPPTFVGSINIPASHTSTSLKGLEDSAPLRHSGASTIDHHHQAHSYGSYGTTADHVPHLMDISGHPSHSFSRHHTSSHMGMGMTIPNTPVSIKSEHHNSSQHSATNLSMHHSNTSPTAQGSSSSSSSLSSSSTPVHHSTHHPAMYPGGAGGASHHSTGSSAASGSPPGHAPLGTAAGHSSSNDSSPGGSSNNDDDSTPRMPPKKRPHSVPDDSKDSTYWEKRKKNNESAKRSRDARRMKEEQIAMRVVYLEQENLQLRTEVSLLKNEIEKLRCMLYNS